MTPDNATGRLEDPVARRALARVATGFGVAIPRRPRTVFATTPAGFLNSQAPDFAGMSAGFGMPNHGA